MQIVTDPAPPARPALPLDDPDRETLHNEVHTRPTARVRLPAVVLLVAVLNEGIDRQQELDHLRRLPGHDGLQPEDLAGSFIRLRLPDGQLKWERHNEFTRYSLVQELPQAEPGAAGDGAALPYRLAVDAAWLAGVPGRTIAAIEMLMLSEAVDDEAAMLRRAQRWFGHRPVVASMMGGGHSCAVTDFRLRPDGFERMLVVAPPGTTDTRAGRISARLLELEIYRLMALRALPVAKALQPLLASAETRLAEITARMEHNDGSDETLLQTLVSLAAGIERATALHGYRFAATRAYHALVRQRTAELRERAIPGTQTLGEFMQRRLTPAMATVEATAERLATLSQRIERAGALLRTRVDIARELQNQELLSRLARGQALQLRLQSTVEGLSIAAISYYVVSLLLYGGKAAKAAGAPVHPEILAGALIPLVIWLVWRVTRRIHARLHDRS